MVFLQLLELPSCMASTLSASVQGGGFRAVLPICSAVSSEGVCATSAGFLLQLQLAPLPARSPSCTHIHFS